MAIRLATEAQTSEEGPVASDRRVLRLVTESTWPFMNNAILKEGIRISNDDRRQSPTQEWPFPQPVSR